MARIMALILAASPAVTAEMILMPLGDSFTVSPGSRVALADQLTSNQWNFRYAGDASVDPWRYQAWGGMTFHQMLHGRLIDNRPGVVDAYPLWEPDIVFLFGGANDLFNDPIGDISTSIDAWTELADFTIENTGWFLVANQIPWLESRRDPANAHLWNEYLTTEIPRRQALGQKIKLLDVAELIDPSVHLRADGLHPNDAGSRLVGEAWYPVVLDTGAFIAVPEPSAWIFLCCLGAGLAGGSLCLRFRRAGEV